MDETRITRQQLRALRVGRSLYRWFLQRFPEGGDYQAIHAALINDGRTEWLESLVEYAYATGFGIFPFLQQELASTEAMAVGLTRGPTEKLHIASRLASTGRFTPTNTCTLQFATGDHALNIGCSGFQSKMASTGNGNFMAQSGENSSIASAGYGCQLVSCGFGTKVGNTGQNSRISSLGDRARISNSGNAVKISSAGRGTCIANSGRRTYLSSAGDATRLVNAGESNHIHTLGERTLIANSGDNVTVQVMGNDSVMCSLGSVTVFRLGKNGCAALAYHDGERTRFVTVYAGENGILAGVAYRLTAKGVLLRVDDEITEAQRA